MDEVKNYSHSLAYDTEDDNIDIPARNYVPVRSLHADDLDAVVRIDRRITGHNRREYYESRFKEVLEQSGIRVSLIGEVDGDVAGVIMARVDYGEFGRTEPAAVIDTIDVDPGFRHKGVGRALMSQLLANMNGLRIDAIRTTVNWDDFELLAFFEECGFKPSQRLVFKRTIPPA